MNFRCDNCGTTTEVKISDNCPQCGSEKFRPIMPEERLYLKSISNANTLMTFSNTLSVLMIIGGSIITLVGLLNFVLLILGISVILSGILMMYFVRNQGLMLINLAELNRSELNRKRK